VTNSDLFIDYLLEDGREVFDDLVLERRRQMGPEFSWVDGHKTSQATARSMRSVSASRVNLEEGARWAERRLVAESGIFKEIESR
jgi:hypothetical protein